MLVLATPSLLGYSLLGQADHHTLIALAGTISIGAGLRALRGRRPGGMAWACGLAGGFGLWTSPEAILLFAPMLAGFGTAWLLGPDPAGAARQGMRAAGAALATLALAVTSEHGSGALRFVAYDVVALPHLALLAAAFAVFGICSVVQGGRATRMAAGSVAGGAALALTTLAFPGLWRASMSDAAPEALAYFLPTVIEMQPVRFAGWSGMRGAIATFGGAAIVSPLVLAVVARRWARGPRRALLAPLVLLLLLTGFATVQAVRFSADLVVPAAIIAAGVPTLLTRWLADKPLILLSAARASATMAIFLLPALSVIGPAEAAPPSAGCRAEPLARWLGSTLPAASGAQRPIVFNVDINAAPALGWFAPVRVVAGPYHRGGKALGDTVQVLEAPTAEAAAQVLRERGASFLLLCQGLHRNVRQPAFLDRLAAGDEHPSWLVPVALPPDLAGRFGLWRVVKSDAAQAGSGQPQARLPDTRAAQHGR
jgi:hypothetical protein